MAKRKEVPDRPRDLNQLGKKIVDLATGQDVDAEPQPTDEKARKRGQARAAKLTPERRSQIAQDAAKARWGT